MYFPFFSKEAQNIGTIGAQCFEVIMDKKTW
jgi:hypothetical protein